MFDDFFYHKPVTAAGTNLDGITRATQVSVGSFQVRNSGEPKFRWSKWNAKEFFPLDDLDGVFFSRKLLNFVWFAHFSDHFDFDFG